MRTHVFPVQRDRRPRRSNSFRPRIESFEPRTLLSAVSWTGAAGDNNWDTASNWSTDSVPGAGDDVTIDIAANVVHSERVSDSINSLTSSEPLTISGGTLSIAAASTIDNTLSITGGTLTGTGDVTVSGLVTLTAGTLSGASEFGCQRWDGDQPDRRPTSIWTAARSTTPPERRRRGPARSTTSSRRRTAASSTTWAHSWSTAWHLTSSQTRERVPRLTMREVSSRPRIPQMSGSTCRSTCLAVPSTSRATVNWT